MILDRLRDLIERLGSYPLWEIGLELVLIWIVVFALVRFIQGTRAAGVLKGLLFVLVIGTLVVIEANGFGNGVVVGLFDARRVFSAKLTS